MTDSPTGGRMAWPEEPAHKRDTDVDPRNRPTRVQLTPEEIQLLKEYRTESFWYNCLPLAGLNCAVVHLLARRGYMKSHPRFGYLFSYMGAIGFGYIGGKLMAFPKFKEKILNLQEGALADEFRKGKSGLDVVRGEPNQDQNDLTYRPEDNFKPYVQNPDTNKTETSYRSYEDIRRQNRLEFDQNQPPPSLPMNQPSRPPSRPASDYEFQASQPKFKTNKYGDIVEE